MVDIIKANRYDELQSEQEVIDNNKMKQKTKKIIIGLALLVIIGLVIGFSGEIGQAINAYQEWVERNRALGIFTYMVVYAVATICAFPGSILTLGAGFVFAAAFNSAAAGIFIGSFVVFVGASTGAVGAFLLGRYILRDSVSNLVSKYPKFKAIDTVLEEEGFKMVALLRLSPLLPFNAFNYMMGITGVKLRDYTLACIGLLPGTFAFVAVGTSAESLSDLDAVTSNPLIIVFIVLGTLVALAMSIYLSVVAKRKINEILERNKLEEEEMGMKSNPTEGDIETEEAV